MTEYYDSEGNLVECVLSPEEAQQIKAVVENKEKEMIDVKEKLGKLENKDYNFKKLREMTEEEKKSLSIKEMELIKRQEKLEEDAVSFKTQVVESHKIDALAVLAGDDEELRKKVLYHYGRIKDEAVTKDEINKKMKEAFLLTTGRSAEINPLYQAHNYQGSPTTKRIEGKLTDEQKDLGKKLGLSDKELEK